MEGLRGGNNSPSSEGKDDKHLTQMDGIKGDSALREVEIQNPKGKNLPSWKSLVKDSAIIATPKNEYGIPIEVWFWPIRAIRRDGGQYTVFLQPSVKISEVHKHYGPFENTLQPVEFLKKSYGAWCRISLDKNRENPPRKYLWMLPFFIRLEGVGLKRLEHLLTTDIRTVREETPFKFFALFRTVKLKHRFFNKWRERFYTYCENELWDNFLLEDFFAPGKLEEFIIKSANLSRVNVNHKNRSIYTDTVLGLLILFKAFRFLRGAHPDLTLEETIDLLVEEDPPIGIGSFGYFFASRMMENTEVFLKLNTALTDALKVVDLFYETLRLR